MASLKTPLTWRPRAANQRLQRSADAVVNAAFAARPRPKSGSSATLQGATRVLQSKQSRPSTRRSTPMNKHHTRTPTGLLFLGMIAAAPLAFAQSTTPTEQQTPTQAQAQAGAAQQSQAGASGQGQSWADLDTDGNGSISRSEAQAHSALSSVFATADADGDGELTPEEYRTFIQNQQQGGAPQERREIGR